MKPSLVPTSYVSIDAHDLINNISQASDDRSVQEHNKPKPRSRMLILKEIRTSIERNTRAAHSLSQNRSNLESSKHDSHFDSNHEDPASKKFKENLYKLTFAKMISLNQAKLEKRETSKTVLKQANVVYTGGVYNPFGLSHLVPRIESKGSKEDSSQQNSIIHGKRKFIRELRSQAKSFLYQNHPAYLNVPSQTDGMSICSENPQYPDGLHGDQSGHHLSKPESLTVIREEDSNMNNFSGISADDVIQSTLRSHPKVQDHPSNHLMDDRQQRTTLLPPQHSSLLYRQHSYENHLNPADLGDGVSPRSVMENQNSALNTESLETLDRTKNLFARTEQCMNMDENSGADGIYHPATSRPKSTKLHAILEPELSNGRRHFHTNQIVFEAGRTGKQMISMPNYYRTGSSEMYSQGDIALDDSFNLKPSNRRFTVTNRPKNPRVPQEGTQRSPPPVRQPDVYPEQINLDLQDRRARGSSPLSNQNALSQIRQDLKKLQDEEKLVLGYQNLKPWDKFLRELQDLQVHVAANNSVGLESSQKLKLKLCEEAQVSPEVAEPILEHLFRLVVTKCLPGMLVLEQELEDRLSQMLRQLNAGLAKEASDQQSKKTNIPHAGMVDPVGGISTGGQHASDLDMEGLRPVQFLTTLAQNSEEHLRATSDVSMLSRRVF